MIHDVGQISQTAIDMYFIGNGIHQIFRENEVTELDLRDVARLQFKQLPEQDKVKPDLLIVSPSVQQMFDDWASALPIVNALTGELAPAQERRTVSIYNTGFSAPWMIVNPSWSGQSRICLTTKEAVVNRNLNYPAILAVYT